MDDEQRQRERLDVSLLRAGLYTIHTDLAIQLFFGRNASTRPRAEAYNPLTNFFRTKDDAWICIVARAGNADLPRMARAFDLPGIDTAERFLGGKARRDNAAYITALFDEAFAAFVCLLFELGEFVGKRGGRGSGVGGRGHGSRGSGVGGRRGGLG